MAFTDPGMNSRGSAEYRQSVHGPAATWPEDTRRVLIFLREIVASTPPGPPTGIMRFRF